MGEIIESGDGLEGEKPVGESLANKAKYALWGTGMALCTASVTVSLETGSKSLAGALLAAGVSCFLSVVSLQPEVSENPPMNPESGWEKVYPTDEKVILFPKRDL